MLSQYCLITQIDGGLVLDPSIVPYDVTTPLFSNYAIKERGVWLPPGAAPAVYDPVQAFAFPQGTVILKSFGFPDDLRKPSPSIDWIETRLLINSDAGWHGYTYIWNDGGGDATLSYAGETTPVAWIDEDGGTTSTNYLVPSYGQCRQCHQDLANMVPIGPKARDLNQDYAYPAGAENQLVHWTRVGILTGAPADAGSAPYLPVWDDPTTGTLEQRARAYLESNCAYCHYAEGYANTTGLFLEASQTDPLVYGVCKPPVAAGPATGGFQFDVVPGSPDTSIMIYRMSSIVPGTAMPLIDRSLVDTEGVALVSQWIAEMDGGCP